jgi:hypothetical protein
MNTVLDPDSRKNDVSVSSKSGYQFRIFEVIESSAFKQI